MANVSIELDAVALREATNQAIMGVLTPQIREELIRKAIVQLLAPSPNSWENKITQLEAAFEQAVYKYAHEVCRDMVNNDLEIKAKIRDLIRQTADKILNADLGKMADRMADAFVASCRRD